MKVSPAPNAAAGMTLPVTPVWLRRALGSDRALAGQDIADIAILTGAAIGALDALVRHQAPWQGLWRQRLAMTSAEMTARQVGRTEDEAALRDAVLLTRPGDDVGPGGRLFLGWQLLAVLPAGELLKHKSLGALLKNFGYPHDDDAVAALADDVQQIGQSSGIADNLTHAFAISQRHGLGPAVGAFIADALLAQRLGWERAVPLLGAEDLPRRAMRRSKNPAAMTEHEAAADDGRKLLVAQARAALRAIDLSAMLAHRGQRLLAVAPKLRAKASDSVVELLLSEDAIVASRHIAGISDRGLRRMFDRLIELGAVRELTGRPTFRIYGL